MGHVWSALGKNGKQKKNTRNNSRASANGAPTRTETAACISLWERINILWPWQWNTPEHPVPFSLFQLVSWMPEAKKHWHWVGNFFETDFHCQGEVLSLTTGVLEHVSCSNKGSEISTDFRSWWKLTRIILILENVRTTTFRNRRSAHMICLWFAFEMSKTLQRDTLIDNTSLSTPALRL